MRNKPLPGLCPKDSPLKMHGMLEKKTGLGPRANPTKKPVSEKDKKIQHDMWDLEDKMKDAGVVSIGGQKENQE